MESTHLTRDLLGALGARLRQLSWVTVIVFAAVVCFVDGFWATALRGAVGAIEHTQGPFESWLRTSALILPLFIAAVVVALLITRAFRRRLDHPVAIAALAGVLVVALTTTLALTQIAVVSALDYHDQSQQLDEMFGIHAHAPTASDTANPGPIVPVSSRLADARRSTLDAHVRGLKQATVIVLLTNVLVVAFLLVLRGDHLWAEQDEEPLAAPASLQPTT